MRRSTWWPEGDGVESKVIRGVVVYRFHIDGRFTYYCKMWPKLYPRVSIEHYIFPSMSASRAVYARRNLGSKVV